MDLARKSVCVSSHRENPAKNPLSQLLEEDAEFGLPVVLVIAVDEIGDAPTKKVQAVKRAVAYA
jgi:hypothetical protein